MGRYIQNPRKLCKLLEEHGWYFLYQTGSHRFYGHPTVKDKIPVPCHSAKDIPLGTVKQIYRKLVSTDTLSSMIILVIK